MTYQCLRAIKEPCLSPVVTLLSPCFAASPREPLLKRFFCTKNNSVNSSLEQIKEESQMKQVKVKLTRAELDKNKKESKHAKVEQMAWVEKCFIK